MYAPMPKLSPFCSDIAQTDPPNNAETAKKVRQQRQSLSSPPKEISAISKPHMSLTGQSFKKSKSRKQTERGVKRAETGSGGVPCPAESYSAKPCRA